MKIFLASTIWIACALLAGCNKPNVEQAALPSVFVIDAKNDVGSQVQVISASIRPRIESDIAFRAGGKVVARLVDVGQHVKTGQMLARIDANDYQLGLEAARELMRAAEVDATQSASDAARFRRLLADGSISAADVERQQAKADAAAARLSQAKQQLALAMNRVGYANLVAPFDGVVTAMRVETGQVVAEGQPVLTIARPVQLEVVADIPEALAGSLRSYTAAAHIGSASDYLPLKLRELAPSASLQTRTFRARYAIGNGAASSLQIGMTAELHLSRGGQTASTLLPSSAILSTNRAASVWVVDEKSGALTRRAVTLLSSGTEMVRVGGLQDGELVVTVGAQKLDANMKVRPQRRPLAMTASSGESP